MATIRLGSRIKGGVAIHGPAAIHPYTIVDTRSHIDRSFVWRNSYIGEGAELRGAIIGQRCSLKTKAVVFEGAVIGDECTVGDNAVIHPNVKIWPNKEIEAGATVKSSLIWGSQARRALFGRYGVTGLVNVDLTPEFAARLSAAFGSTLPKGSTVTINRDPHRAARMIKRAMASGLPSAGVTVQDLESVPIPVARYFTATTDKAGGVHKEMPDPGPAFANGVENALRARRIRDVGRCQIEHQQPAVGIHGNMAFASRDLLAGVVAPCLGRRRLYRLAVDHRRRRTGLAPRAITIEHQLDVVDCLEKKPSRQFAEPRVDRLPRAEMHRQHAPAAA